MKPLGIDEVVREYAAAFPHATVLVVDNGSEDGTAATAADGWGASNH